MSAQYDGALRRRERRREQAVLLEPTSEFCDVCHYNVRYCRCAGARLFLREEIARLRNRIAAAVEHLDRTIDTDPRPLEVVRGDAQLARHALTGASSRAAEAKPRRRPLPKRGAR